MGYILTFLAGAALAGLIAWQLTLRGLRRHHNHERALLKRTRRAEKMAELGKLTSHLAHEIRNPLSIIKINLKLLIEDIQRLSQNLQSLSAEPSAQTDELRQRYRRQLLKMETINGEADRLARTLDEFLRYAGKMELHPIRADLNELLEELVDFYTPQAQAGGVQLRQSLPGAPIYAKVDADLIKQAILNLLINATQAMSDGGELIIRCAAVNDQAQIQVIDTGPGIPVEDQEQIFEAYYTTKSGGTGLGLPTCRRIIEEHGGEIQLHSEPGKGTSFTINVPTVT